ncbi:MAG: hypothetical protein QXX34_03560 [Candidatus Bathyarchaeia archaeon]
MKKYFCDICGKELDPADISVISADSTIVFLFKKEVCSDCIEEIKQYIETMEMRHKR